jgi:hypothetical protein
VFSSLTRRCERTSVKQQPVRTHINNRRLMFLFLCGGFFFFFFLKIIVIYNVVKVAIRVFNHVLYSSARKNGHKDVIVSDGFFPIVVVVSFFFLFFFLQLVL